MARLRKEEEQVEERKRRRHLGLMKSSVVNPVNVGEGFCFFFIIKERERETTQEEVRKTSKRTVRPTHELKMSPAVRLSALFKAASSLSF